MTKRTFKITIIWTLSITVLLITKPAPGSLYFSLTCAILLTLIHYMGIIFLHLLFPPQLPLIINNVHIYVAGFFPPTFFFFNSRILL